MRLALMALALVVCAGCNTVSGLGKDLQTVGGVMTETAEEAK